MRALALLIATSGICAWAEEVAFDVARTPGEFRVANSLPANTPTVYVVGVPDRGAKPWRLTKGVTLNGVRLTERLLSESVLILRPNGTGQWGYWPGFDVFRLPSDEPPRETVHYGKYRYDPIVPPRLAGADINYLRVDAAHPVVYEIAFPNAMRIRRFQIACSCDRFDAGATLGVGLFSDAECEREIASVTLRSRPSRNKPIVFDKLDTPRAYLRIAGMGRGQVWLYRMLMEARLDTSRVKLPIVPAGESTWRVTDEADSSHRARIVLRWAKRPRPGDVWESFDGRAPFRGGGVATQALGREHGPYMGRGFQRVEFVADGKNRFLTWRLPKPADLSRFNTLALAVRQPARGRPGPIRIGLRQQGGKSYTYLGLAQHASDWEWVERDISAIPRDRIDTFALFFGMQWGYWKKGTTFRYDIDSLCFTQQETKRDAAPPELPDFVVNHTPKATAPRRAPRLKLQDWFPMGLYHGFSDARAWDFILDDWAAHGIDAWYVSNGTVDKFEQVLPKAEARGIRVIYQGTSASNLYYLHYSNAKVRQDAFRRQIAPRLREVLPRLAGRYGFAALSLTEEIKPEISEELSDYYSLVRRIAPQLPPTLLHNNLAAARRDLDLNHPPVITHDFYPFFWDPRSGPTTPRRSLAFLTKRIDGYYRACRQHGASLWMMLQVHGNAGPRPLDPPHYGYIGGYRAPTPAEIKMQSWVSIAYGATGIFYYTYLGRDGMTSCRNADWSETPQFRAMADHFRTLRKVAPLLCRLERDDREKQVVKVSNKAILAHTFKPRAGYASRGTYVVVVNTDAYAEQTFDLALSQPGPVHDFITGRSHAGALRGYQLAPGEGTVLLLGPDEQFRSNREFIAAELRRWQGREVEG